MCAVAIAWLSALRAVGVDCVCIAVPLVNGCVCLCVHKLGFLFSYDVANTSVNSVNPMHSRGKFGHFVVELQYQHVGHSPNPRDSGHADVMEKSLRAFLFPSVYFLINLKPIAMTTLTYKVDSEDINIPSEEFKKEFPNREDAINEAETLYEGDFGIMIFDITIDGEEYTPRMK